MVRGYPIELRALKIAVSSNYSDFQHIVSSVLAVKTAKNRQKCQSDAIAAALF
jgi:hypothetical protein